MPGFYKANWYRIYISTMFGSMYRIVSECIGLNYVVYRLIDRIV